VAQFGFRTTKRGKRMKNMQKRTDDIIGDLEAIQNTFQNLQGNLTRVTPISQGEVLEDNAAATAATSQPQPQQEEQQPSPQSGQPVF
jgi:hypothetical protein